ncbi:DNA-3-methyladenine glycosylase family protein [Paenibacillus agricola]|uniref:DNA-3-methyladenine glycosylase II n=1 Tax=Paenibacillus agricola TaxID=2716264 RepID=A0ABX0J4P8_9BACL|nr:DNA-3-methyladenine glycosylase [Paenibacillus agricola]NHN31112.1 DNA-3-methyladenine glycosylase 2 family protein [Paenibacillus agricola]
MIEIAVPKPFSFAENINYLSRSPKECMFQVADHKIYKLIPQVDKPLLIEISCNDDSNLLIHYRGDELPASSDEPTRSMVIQYVREWFDLDTDLTLFYEMASQDPLLKQVIKQFYGLRNMGITDFFEALCWGIIGQQINLSYAYTLKKRFVEAYGEYVEWNHHKYWLFPSPQTIASLTVSDLTSLQMSARKSEYLIGVAQLVSGGSLSKQLLLDLKDYKEAEKLLVDIRGIGPWTANYVLMRCLRFPAAFPIADVGLHNAIKHLTGAENKPTLAEIRQLSSTWTNWESYATFYLWRTLY